MSPFHAVAIVLAVALPVAMTAMANIGIFEALVGVVLGIVVGPIVLILQLFGIAKGMGPLWVLTLIEAGIVAIYFGQEILARLHYWFVPHPAAPQMEAATQRDHSVPLDGVALASTLREHPSTLAGFFGRRKHAEELVKDAEAETAYLRAQEELARAAEDMEKARARVDQLKKRRR